VRNVLRDERLCSPKTLAGPAEGALKSDKKAKLNVSLHQNDDRFDTELLVSLIATSNRRYRHKCACLCNCSLAIEHLGRVKPPRRCAHDFRR